MRRTMIAMMVFAAANGLGAQGNTDVFLAPLSVAKGRVTVGAPVNITNRTGYDNQPSFTPDGKSVLFTSTHEDAQADIYRYDLASHQITRLTKTNPESEYSATVMPSGDRFSVIRVERDSTQRLWSFRLDGTDPQIVIEKLKPVGYHAWIDDHRLATFVLGVGRTPNALVLADLRAGTFDTVTRNIGRLLTPLPGGRGYSYAQRVDSGWALMRVEGPVKPTDKGREVARLPAGADYVAWVTPEIPVTGTGSKLMQWDSAGRTWRTVADFGTGSVRLNRVSRLAVSPDGKWIAIVAEP